MAGALARGAIPNFMDPVMYFFPLRVHAARLIHAGELPLWNRCLMGGMPLFENPQAALAYPLHWPFLAWPGGFWYLFPMLFQLGLYAALTTWALRRIGAGRAAWFGGALALAGSYGWSRLQYGNYMNILPWWPLWLGAAHAFAQDGRLRWVIAGSAALALTILGGAHQLAAYGLALLAVYGLVQIIAERGSRRRWLAFMTISFLLAVLISAPGWLPQLGFIRQTSRPGGLDARAVLDGTIGSFMELLKAFVGDWSLLTKKDQWVDAEIAVAIGPIALLLALWIPRRGLLRRAWLGCWIAALVAIALSLRPVMSALLDLSSAFGIFHGPRRWLGAAQWLLVIASALGAVRFVENGRNGPDGRRYIGGAFFIGLLVITAGAPAWFTWRTVEFAMRPAGELMKPEREPLILRAKLGPGERFFVTDYIRDNSYNYRRYDLNDWALPNLSMLWGIEDLGGYEPAQTEAYANFVRKIHETEPWRQPYPAHFGLIQNPRASEAFDSGNVRAAIMPRWGVPMFFRPVPNRPDFSVAAGAWRQEKLCAVIFGVPDVRARLIAIDGNTQRIAGESRMHPISIADDQVVAAGSSSNRPEPPSAKKFVTARFETDNLAAERWALQLAPNHQLIDVYAWGAPDAALWDAAEISGVSALMRYRGKPEYITGVGGEFPCIIGIHANRITIESVKVTRIFNPAKSIVIHDAWWPGWSARIDGKPVPVEKDGLWRAIQLPGGAQRIEMTYRPPLLTISLIMSAFGIVLLLVLIRSKYRC